MRRAGRRRTARSRDRPPRDVADHRRAGAAGPVGVRGASVCPRRCSRRIPHHRRRAHGQRVHDSRRARGLVLPARDRARRSDTALLPDGLARDRSRVDPARPRRWPLAHVADQPDVPSDRSVAVAVGGPLLHRLVRDVRRIVRVRPDRPDRARRLRARLARHRRGAAQRRRGRRPVRGPSAPLAAIHAAGGEQCDDGNLPSGDGCSPDCVVEAGFTCSGEPSVCHF